MSKPLKTFFNWSSGKDSALALHKLRQDKRFSVDLLVTTISMPQDRISMHGVRRSVLLKQFKSMEIPFRIIEIPENVNMEAYDKIMDTQLRKLNEEGFVYSAYGDIFLEDLKKYREDRLQTFGLKGIFPLWNLPVKEAVHEFMDAGFKAVVVSANAAMFSSCCTGKITGHDFFDQLPSNVDICGENGEYHTFCFAGPLFKTPVSFSLGEVVLREYPAPSVAKKNSLLENGQLGFWFRDLL